LPPRAKSVYQANLKYKLFGERYYSEPAAFLRDCIILPEGETWAPYQLETATALWEHRKAAVRGTRGLGKTALKAGLVHWFAQTREAIGLDWKVLMTASIWRQIKLYLAPEIHKWAYALRWDIIGRPEGPYRDGDELQDLAIKLKHGRAEAFASRIGATTEGGHSAELLLLFDEARIIPPGIWDSARGMLTSGKYLWLAQSTPGDPVGRFHDIFSKKRGWADWWTRHVTLEEAIAAGRVSPTWATDMADTFDASDPFYQQQVLGDFASQTSGGLIPLSWIEAAQQRWEGYEAEGWTRGAGRPLPVTSIAFDVGGGLASGDASTIAIVRDRFLVEQVVKIPQAPDPSQATMHLAGVLKGLYEQHRPLYLLGDSIGIGAGVVHRLREEGIPCLAFVASAATGLTDAAGIGGFDCWRSAGWHGLRELLDPQSGVRVALPPDDDLTADLVSVGDGGLNSRGQHRAESKDAIRKRLGRSTDAGDAVVMALVGPALYEQWARDNGQRGRLVYDPVQVGRW